MHIAGGFPGRLSNTGGELKLSGAGRQEFARIEQGDSWFPETDGGGHSLVAKAPAGSVIARTEGSLAKLSSAHPDTDPRISSRACCRRC